MVVFPVPYGPLTQIIRLEGLCISSGNQCLDQSRNSFPLKIHSAQLGYLPSDVTLLPISLSDFSGSPSFWIHLSTLAISSSPASVSSINFFLLAHIDLWFFNVVRRRSYSTILFVNFSPMHEKRQSWSRTSNIKPNQPARFVHDPFRDIKISHKSRNAWRYWPISSPSNSLTSS